MFLPGTFAMATNEEQAFLRLEDDQPVLEVWHVGRTTDDRAVEVVLDIIPAYLWVLDYAWPISRSRDVTTYATSSVHGA